MSFPAEFLEGIIYGALVWCAMTGLGLSALLIRDLLKGNVW